MLIALDMAGVAASSDSARARAPRSARAMYLRQSAYRPAEAASGLRLSLGRSTTPADIEFVLGIPCRQSLAGSRLAGLAPKARGRTPTANHRYAETTETTETA